jgi:hypothetical protein
MACVLHAILTLRKGQARLTKTDSRPIFTCIGIIVSIDGANRTITIRMPNGQNVDLVVVPGCHVVLNGEEVRLRLLLAGDTVNAFFVKRGEQFEATRICVLTMDKHVPGEPHSGIHSRSPSEN